MTKRKILQIGAVGLLALVLIVAGVWAVRKGKILSRADITGEGVLPPPENLSAVLPSVADDVTQNYWAYNYVDAVTKPYYGPNKAPIMPFISQPTEASPNLPTNWVPTALITTDHFAYWIVRLKNIPLGNYCVGNVYSNVNSSDPFYGLPDFPLCPAIEYAAKAGWFKNTTLAPGYYYGGYWPSLMPVTVQTMRQVLLNMGYTANIPTDSAFNGIVDASQLNRAATAAFFTYNANLLSPLATTNPGSNPARSVVLNWDFPTDPNAGFDFGYEVQRIPAFDPDSSGNTTYVQDPPEEGMVEGSDFGMFYDISVKPGQTYQYQVRIFNRDGDTSNWTSPVSVAPPSSSLVVAAAQQSIPAPMPSVMPKSTPPGPTAVTTPAKSTSLIKTSIDKISIMANKITRFVRTEVTVNKIIAVTDKITSFAKKQFAAGMRAARRLFSRY